VSSAPRVGLAGGAVWGADDCAWPEAPVRDNSRPADGGGARNSSGKEPQHDLGGSPAVGHGREGVWRRHCPRRHGQEAVVVEPALMFDAGECTLDVRGGAPFWPLICRAETTRLAERSGFPPERWPARMGPPRQVVGRRDVGSWSGRDAALQGPRRSTSHSCAARNGGGMTSNGISRSVDVSARQDPRGLSRCGGRWSSAFAAAVSEAD